MSAHYFAVMDEAERKVYVSSRRKKNMLKRNRKPVSRTKPREGAKPLDMFAWCEDYLNGNCGGCIDPANPWCLENDA